MNRRAVVVESPVAFRMRRLAVARGIRARDCCESAYGCQPADAMPRHSIDSVEHEVGDEQHVEAVARRRKRHDGMRGGMSVGEGAVVVGGFVMGSTRL